MAQLAIADSAILDRLKNLAEKDCGCAIGDSDKPFKDYSINELPLSSIGMASFIDAINEEYCLKLAKKDVLAIRTVSALVQTIAGFLERQTSCVN